MELLGSSAGDRPIYSYRFGSGATTIILVGGMHGGYEWNTVLLAQELVGYFQEREAGIPPAVSLIIVPNANPDGLAAVLPAGSSLQATNVISDTRPGRFNANGVDLNRNWDCRWSEQAYWRDQSVSAGTHPFSEPESKSLRQFFLEHKPALVIFLHSAADAVYVSGCPEPDPPSMVPATVYGEAAGYPVFPSFDHYAITGDAGDWLTTQGIPSFTVELSTHEALDRERNLVGLMAVMRYISGDRQSDGGYQSE